MKNSENKYPDLSFLGGERVIFAFGKNKEWDLFEKEYSRTQTLNWTYFSEEDNQDNYPNLDAIKRWGEEGAYVVIFPTFTKINSFLNTYLDELEEIDL